MSPVTQALTMKDGQLESVPLDDPYHAYSLAFEAEVAFKRDCQVKENWTVMWSPGNRAGAQSAGMVTEEVRRFKAGQRHVVRGTLHFRHYGKEWELDKGTRVDAPR